jgi:tetratricopeptide (TPR) repeat protein
LLAGLSWVALWQRRKEPWILVGWIWYLVMLLPVAGIIQVGLQAHADRYSYLPQIGIYLAVTWLAAEWSAPWQTGRAAMGCLMAGVLAGLMVCAWKQTAYWRDSETVWSRTLACITNNEAAHYNLGNALLRKGRVEDAITQYELALEIKPNYADAHMNLGLALLQMARRDDAITQFEKAVAIKPDFAEAHFNLGSSLAQLGRMDEAILQFQKAVELDRQANGLAGGENPILLRTLATAFGQAGRFADAARAAQQALELARAAGQEDLAAQLNDELKHYQAGLPLHQ